VKESCLLKYTREEIDRFTYEVVGAAIEVHKELGPGLLESVYHGCMYRELMIRKIDFSSHLVVPVDYKGLQISANLRCDFLVNRALVVELKAVDAICPVHEAQLLTYMRLLDAPKGVIINFNCVHLFKEGQKTLVNPLYFQLPRS
jgi:GxxExxY protein